MPRDDNSETTATPGLNATGSVPTYALRQPKHFDFTMPLEWLTWRAQFEDFVRTVDLDQDPEEWRIRLLLHATCPKARWLLASFKLCAKEEKSYVKVVEKFSSPFIHPPNGFYESVKFHRRVQHADESVHEFYAELWQLVRRCGFSPLVEERLVRDRFIITGPIASCQTSCASAPVPHCTMLE